MTDLPATRVPTGPSGSFLLGMLRELQHDQLGAMSRAAAEHGDVAAMTVGPPGRRRRLYLVSHPDGVQRVLAGASAGYRKGTPIQQQISATFGDGLLTSTGPDWLRQRRTLAPLFTRSRNDEYVAVMAREAERLAARWSTVPSGRVDLHHELTEYALRVVGLTLFGDDLDGIAPTIRTALPLLSTHALQRGMSPIPLPAGWPTPTRRRAGAAQQALFTAVDTVVARRRRARTNRGGGTDGADLVSLLLTTRDPQTGAPLSDREVRDQALIFLLAGHETTATALTFTLHLLGRDDHAQQRIRHQTRTVLAGQPLRADHLPELTRAAEAVDEAMRLYPPAHSFARIAVTDDVVDGHRIPAGATVFVSPWVTHRREDLWPDPLRFDPRRFRSDPDPDPDPDLRSDTVAARHRYAYFPFGGGPRACIGSHFARTEAVAATAVLVTACRLHTDPNPVPLATGLTLRPAGPVPCDVTPSGSPSAAV